MTLGKLLNISVLQFPHLENCDNDSAQRQNGPQEGSFYLGGGPPQGHFCSHAVIESVCRRGELPLCTPSPATSHRMSKCQPHSKPVCPPNLPLSFFTISYRAVGWGGRDKRSEVQHRLLTNRLTAPLPSSWVL